MKTWGTLSTGTRYNYDNVGNITAVQNKTATLEFDYDEAGTLLDYNTSSGYIVVFYPATSLKLPAISASFTYYDNNARKTMELDLSSDFHASLDYEYDPDWQLVLLRESLSGSINSNSDAEFIFKHDQFGRRSSVQGLVSSARFDNELHRLTTYSYNTSGLLSEIVHFDDFEQDNADLIQDFLYGDVNASGCSLQHVDSSGCDGYDPAGRRRSMQRTDNLGINIDRYGYDRIDRLIETTYDHASSATPATESFVYDDSGNRTSGPAGSASFNNLNQPEQDVQFDYEFDFNGNLKKKTARAGTQEPGYSVNYYFDPENHLTSINATRADGSIDYRAKFAYDALGRRVAMATLGAPSLDWGANDVPVLPSLSSPNTWRITFFAHDGDNVIAEYSATRPADQNGYMQETTTADPEYNLALNAHYLQGPGPGDRGTEPLVWWMRDVRDPDWRSKILSPNLYFADAPGSITAIAGYDPDGGAVAEQTVLATYTYDAYGNQTATCGDLALLNRYRYTD